MPHSGYIIGLDKHLDQEEIKTDTFVREVAEGYRSMK
jgi:hypothetical protein